MKSFNRSSQFKDSPFKALRELRIQCVKLEQISVRLRKRDESLFELCTRAIESEERERAKIYAKELAQVRTIINAVYKSEIAIEYITIKLENLLEFQNVIAELKPVVSDVRSLMNHISEVTPEITHVMEQLNNLVNSTLIETSLDFSRLPLPFDVKLDSDTILREVTSHIEQKLEKALPEPPSLAVTRKEAVNSKKEREAVQIAVG